MSLTIYQADAFTDKPFAGNPAAVCILPKAADEQWMQYVAREMNLSETAFLYKFDDGYNLRWFTPTVEVELCGHATLASAHILWETGVLPQESDARFHTLSGILTAKRDGAWIELDFPATPVSAVDDVPLINEGLAINPKFTGQSKFDYLVEVESEGVLRGLKPDYGKIGRITVRGVIATAKSDSSDFDFVSRYFAPAYGIDEDPATGSIQCALGPYWQEKLGKDVLLGCQASPRGGVMRVKPMGDRVRIGGQAVTVMRGELV